MFNVGDTVVYAHFNYNDSWNGSVGVVREIHCEGFDEDVTAVAWETGEAMAYQDSQYPGRGFVRNFTGHLKPLGPLKYDPTQTGDTDEDV